MLEFHQYELQRRIDFVQNKNDNGFNHVNWDWRFSTWIEKKFCQNWPDFLPIPHFWFKKESGLGKLGTLQMFFELGKDTMQVDLDIETHMATIDVYDAKTGESLDCGELSFDLKESWVILEELVRKLI